MEIREPICCISRPRQATAQFNYDRIPNPLRSAIYAETLAIRGLLGKTSSNIIQIGLRLRFVHNRVGREHFQEWLRAEFAWSQSVASNYMRAAEVFGNLDCADKVLPSAMYALARKKVSSKTRREAISLAKGGEIITKSRAQSLIDKYGCGAIQEELPAIARVRRYLQNLAKGLPTDEAESLAVELFQFANRLRSPS